MFFYKYRFVAILGLIFGAVLYFQMSSLQLTNTFDGLWQQNYHHAGVSELTSGRWLLIFSDKLMMGLHSDPITTALSLVMYIIGFLLVLDLFRIKNSLHGFICLALFLSSTAVSSTLSYRFTSFGYGLAFLLATLSVYAAVKIRKGIAAVGVSGVLLGLCVACYQAYSAVFCIAWVFYIIFLCAKTGTDDIKDKGNLIRNLLRMVCSVVVGAIFYIVTLLIFLAAYNASLSDYNGIGGTTLGELLFELPSSLIKAYRYFGAYFFMDTLKINRLHPFGIFILVFLLLAAIIVYIAVKLWKVKKQRIVPLLLAVTAIPPAANAYMLAAGDKLELQMTAGIAMLVPLTAIMAFSTLEEIPKKRLLQGACTVLCVALLYGGCMQVLFDEEAMYEGQNACETMANQVIGDLNRENLLSPDFEYYFVGVPARNPFFSVSEIYQCANAYAQVGNFWVSGNCCQMSYNGLVSKRMGFELPMSWLGYEDIARLADVEGMPVFPSDGYITLLDDRIVIIKISEYSEYTGASKYVIS